MMARRDTRNKLRHICETLRRRCDSMVASLKLLDELAQGRIEIINRDVPVLVSTIETLKEYAIDLRRNI